MVQDIASDFNDDEVNSISDTVESLQIAQILKSVYFEIIDGRKWGHLQTLVNLQSSSDSEKPTHLKIPEDVRELEMFEYNSFRNLGDKDSYQEVKYVTPDEFLRKCSYLNSDADNVMTITDYSGVKLQVTTNNAPTYWTSFDDEWIICNSYNSVIDSTLRSSKTRALVYKDPVWKMVDNFVPDLPSEAFSYFLAEAKSVASVRLKQRPDAKAEQQSNRQRMQMNRNAWKAAGGIRMPNYGRRSRK